MTSQDGLNNVETLINRFGGMRPMARKVDVAVSTVQGWKKRDHIPADRVPEVIRAAKNHNVSLNDVANTSSNTQTASENAKKTSGSASIDTGEDIVSNTIPTESLVKPKNHSTSSPKKQQSNKPTYSMDVQMDAGYIKQQVVSRSIITTLCVLGVVGGLGYVIFKNDIDTVTSMANDQQQVENRLDAYRTEYQSFEQTVTDGLNAVTVQATEIAAAVGIQRNAEGDLILNNNMSLSDRLIALESRLRAGGSEIDLGQLMTQLNDVTKGEGAYDRAAMAELKMVVNGLQGQMQNLDVALMQAKQNNAALAKSLENVNGKDLGAAAMLLTMTHMRSSLDREQPFSNDLSMLQQLIGSDDPELTMAINRLAPYAERGILSPEGISMELKSLTGEIVTAALNGEDVSVQDKMTARLGEILSVEKDGQPMIAIEEQRIIAKAQTALEQGDTKTALAELSKLEGGAAQAAAPVTNQVYGALAADQTMTMMLQNLLTKLQHPQGLQDVIQSIPQDIKN